ncbi:MAG: PqqD family protein [Chloroflexota bacterium]
MNLSTKLKRSPDASYEVVAGEAIVIHLKSGVYYSLNEVGTAFWNLLDGAHTIADCAQLIAAQIVDERPPLDVIVADLTEIADHLAKEKLVSVS